jgi:hypothetical protein
MVSIPYVGEALERRTRFRRDSLLVKELSRDSGLIKMLEKVIDSSAAWLK